MNANIALQNGWQAEGIFEELVATYQAV